MTQGKTPKPTERELEILAVLWQRGTGTVRDVNEILNQRQPTGYTTTLKLMQIMAEKGLVLRDEAQRTHVYRARHKPEEIQRRLVGELLEKALGGSAEKLVMHALSAKKISTQELEQIKKLLESFEGA